MNRSVLGSTAVGFVVAAVAFAAMFWVVDTETVLAAVRRADPVLVALVGATVLCWNVSWGLALWNVLQALDVDVPLRVAVLVNAAGAFVNHVSPFGQAGGEPVIAYLLSRTADVEYERNLAAVTSLDAINVVPSLSFAVIGVVYYVATATVSPRLEILFAGVILVAVGFPTVGVVAWHHRRTLERRAAGVATRAFRILAPVLPRAEPSDADGVADRLAGFVSSLEVVAADRRRLAAAVGCSAFGWGIQAVGLWLAFLAVGSSVPLYVPFFVVPIGTMASVVPTPGGLGGIEVVNVTLVVLVTGVSAGTSAVAVTLHSVGGYLLTTAVGAVAATILSVRS